MVRGFCKSQTATGWLTTSLIERAKAGQQIITPDPAILNHTKIACFGRSCQPGWRYFASRSGMHYASEQSIATNLMQVDVRRAMQQSCKSITQVVERENGGSMPVVFVVSKSTTEPRWPWGDKP